MSFGSKPADDTLVAQIRALGVKPSDLRFFTPARRAALFQEVLARQTGNGWRIEETMDPANLALAVALGLLALYTFVTGDQPAPGPGPSPQPGPQPPGPGPSPDPGPGPSPQPQPQPPGPLPGGGDQIDMASVVITSQSPDVRSWPIGAQMRSLSLSGSAGMGIDFDRKTGPNAWPAVVGGGFTPPGIQYTLWVACFIGGVWYASGVICCIEDYIPTGPTLQSGQLPNNWYYFAGGPLDRYQPAPGEQVAFWVTSGIQRRDNTAYIYERSNAVLVPFSEGSYSF